MDIINKEMLWSQFGAAIDMFTDTLRDCPEEMWQQKLWDDKPDQWFAMGFASFWYLAYHTLFWMDLYLFGAEEGFSPPAPFDLVEMEPHEALPRVYSRDELLGYTETCRRKCRQIIDNLTHEQANRLCLFSWGELPYAELLLYNLRHVQEHGAQLRMFLGQQVGKAASWVPRAR